MDQIAEALERILKCVRGITDEDLLRELIQDALQHLHSEAMQEAILFCHRHSD